jgi:hypothetical protein
MTAQDKTTQDYTTGRLHQTEGNTKTTSALETSWLGKIFGAESIWGFFSWKVAYLA